MNLIQHLVKNKLINEVQLQHVKLNGKDKHQSLLEVILMVPGVDEHAIGKCTAKYFQAQFIDLIQEISDETLSLLPESLIKKYSILPLSKTGEDTLKVVMCDPSNIMITDDLQAVTPYRIEPVVAPLSQIRLKIKQYFDHNKFGSVLTTITEFSEKKIQLDDELLNSKSAILNADQSPVVNLVNKIIIEASNQKASDIHIEPSEKNVEIRYRIDGILKEKLTLPKQVHKHLISRLKIMADLDIAECRKPQDGRIRFSSEEKNLNLRISTIPTIYGEKVVLRLMDSVQMNIDLNRLASNPHDLALLKGMIKQPQGMILVCGPTGSGKTSTLYAIINHIKSKEKNIVTIEDPVEQTIEGINQTQVNERIGLTFAKGLRTILRQDPNCILVGEIRDQETADIAFRSSLTGHLVLSTLHTNCSISAITRLRDMGVEPFLISTTLLGIISQRLLRVNCEHCKKFYKPEEFLLEKYHNFFAKTNGGTTLIKGEGCARCGYTGYAGRMAVFELLSFNSQLRQLINTNACEETIKKEVRKTGFTTLIEQALVKVREGETTLEELENVIGNYGYSDKDHGSSSVNTPHQTIERIEMDNLVKNDFSKFIGLLNNFL